MEAACLPRLGIHRADIQPNTAKQGVLCWCRFVAGKHTPINFLKQENGGPAGKGIRIAGELLSGCAGGDERDYLGLRQWRIAAEDRFGSGRRPGDVNSDIIVTDRRGSAQIEDRDERLVALEVDEPGLNL